MEYLVTDMINGWKVCNIEELGTIARGRSKHRPRNDEVLFGGKYPFIQTADVKQTNLYIESYSSTYNDIGLKQSKLWPKGTLCITIAANIAETGILGIDACFPDSIVGFTPYPCTSDVRFVKYMIDMLKIYMQQISKGTTQDNLSLSKIAKIKFEVPNYEIQVKIADTLSMYDDLIANNNKRIKILEQMAENLYKEWFVRFRFPGYETAEFVDGVPKNWTYYKLKELLEIFYGKDHKNISDGNIPVFGSGGIMRYGNKALYEGEAVLIPRKGTLNNIMYYNGELWTVDTMFYAVSQIHNSAKYIYYTLSNFDMESYNSGAALPSMTTSILYNLKVLLPDKNALKKFDDIVGKIFDEKKCLEMQNQNLIKQRDYLLPRLMSGKLQVK